MLKRELPGDEAAHLASTIQRRLAGMRLSIPTKHKPCREEIVLALSQCRYDVTRAAQRLGVNRATLYR